MNSMVKISSQFKMEMKFSDGIAFFFFFLPNACTNNEYNRPVGTIFLHYLF